MQYALLTQRSLIAVTGEDAFEFLQGLVSNDVLRVKGGQAAYTALLTPQGKFLHDFFVLPHEGGALIDIDQTHAADLLQRLKTYKLRSKVSIEAKSVLGVAAAWGGTVAGKGPLVVADPRLPALGYRIVSESPAVWCQEQGMQREDEVAYERMRLELGVPDGARDMVVDKSLLLEFGFEDLRGVDFKKGCYVGQEVTARSKFRGQVRKFIYQVRSDKLLPPAGTPVASAENEVGEMRSSSGNVGLALLRIEEVEKAKGRLLAGSVPVTATLPVWAAALPPAG